MVLIKLASVSLLSGFLINRGRPSSKPVIGSSRKITIGHRRPPQSASPSRAFCKDCQIKCFCPLSDPSSHKLLKQVLPMHSDQKYSYCSGPFLPDDRPVWSTRSISSWTFFKFSSRTTMANTEVPADTFPVRTATLLVAVIPVPASPSGGQRDTCLKHSAFHLKERLLLL